IFLAADADLVETLDSDVRSYLAWQSVIDDQEALNLDAHQRRQSTESVSKMDKTVNIRLNEAFVWLLVPMQEGTKPIKLEAIRVTRGEGSFVAKASRQIRSEELLIPKWSPALLKVQLDKWLWKDKKHISLKQLWEYFASYPYLPRLKDSSVLIECIREGLRSRDFFGYAASVDDKGKYMGLEFGNPGAGVVIDSISVLVKKEHAQKQKEDEERKEKENYPAKGTGPMGQFKEGPHKSEKQIIEESKKETFKRFYGRVNLDSTRMSRDAGQIAEEVIQHLVSLPDANVDITLEINAKIGSGIPEKKVRVLLENCKTLKFEINDFEEE
ncbi:MAG: hypothetical protein KKF44_09970, partial [Nanoarchaeota archaeon]|nr:hypothetical protein [Nanoarchaeota archaeon]